MDENLSPGLKIDQVAETTGLTKRTIRYYEEIGLLPPAPRSKGNYRLYQDADVERLNRIAYLRDVVGLCLADIQRLMGVEDHLSDLKQHFRAHDGREEKLKTLDAYQEQLNEYQRLLERRMEALESEKAQVTQRLEKVAQRKREL